MSNHLNRSAGNSKTLAKEMVGSAFDVNKMLSARALTQTAVKQIAQAIQVGMRESQARQIAQQILIEMKHERIWHPIIIRFAANTLHTFRQASVGDPQLQADDIFFIDLGVVWDGHEGDAGDTFVIGQDPDKLACAQAARTLFGLVEKHWRETECSGVDLYDYAAQRADQMGWKLNLEIKGHRVSDFPHAIYRAGDLGDFAACPNTGLWVLEIQIAHHSKAIGAFYEDLLVK